MLRALFKSCMGNKARKCIRDKKSTYTGRKCHKFKIKATAQKANVGEFSFLNAVDQ